MTIDLLNLQPHVVSRDLSQKIILIYGREKVGKTTLATKFPKSLLLALEKGYNALSGVMAQNITKWSDFKKALRQLENPLVKEKFSTIIIDTVDLAYDACEKFIVQREGVDKIGDIPYGAGYKMVRNEFDSALRSIPMMDYGLVMISHAQEATFVDEGGNEYTRTTTTLSKQAKSVVHPMADIIGYAKAIEKDGETKVALFLRATTQFDAGSRFKHVPNVIELNYDKLVNVIADAIEKEEEEKGQTTVVEKGVNLYAENNEKLSFDDLKTEIKELTAKLVEAKGEDAKKIMKTLVEQHLGKGRTLKDVTESQVEQLSLIAYDLKEML